MLPLIICPGCRRLTDGELNVHTLEPIGDVLACTSCARRYPIIDGVPIVLADPGHYLRAELSAVVERDLPLDVASLIVEYGADDAPYAQLLEHVSIYMDAHWGDFSKPSDGFASQPILDKLAALPRIRNAVELGCSAGRIVAELSRRADHVIGVDLQFATLRRGRRVLSGEDIGYLRRMVGRHYLPVTVRSERRENVRLICGDALDPPLIPGMYDRVVALNLLDSVLYPARLLAVTDGLCAPGGEVILSSPFTWQSGIVDEAGRIGGTDPVSTVNNWFQHRGYHVEDQGDIPWSLRRETRSVAMYLTHYLRVRKPAS